MRLYANSTGPACSVYLEGTTTHNEGRVSTPASVASPVSRNSPAHQLAVSRMPAFSVYLEGTRSHNEGRVSTPACYL